MIPIPLPSGSFSRWIDAPSSGSPILDMYGPPRICKERVVGDCRERVSCWHVFGLSTEADAPGPDGFRTRLDKTTVSKTFVQRRLLVRRSDLSRHHFQLHSATHNADAVYSNTEVSLNEGDFRAGAGRDLVETAVMMPWPPLTLKLGGSWLHGRGKDIRNVRVGSRSDSGRERFPRSFHGRGPRPEERRWQDGGKRGARLVRDGRGPQPFMRRSARRGRRIGTGCRARG